MSEQVARHRPASSRELREQLDRTVWLRSGERIGCIYADPYSGGLRFFVADSHNPFYPSVLVYQVADYGTSENPDEVPQSVRRSIDTWVSSDSREQQFPEPESGLIQFTLLKHIPLETQGHVAVIQTARANSKTPFVSDQIFITRATGCGISGASDFTRKEIVF